MKQLFSKRIGAYLLSAPYWTIPNVNGDIWAPYPLSKVSFYKNKLVIRVWLEGDFTLYYKNIMSIKKVPLGIRIDHKDKKIKPHVTITGIFNGNLLFQSIVNLIKQNKLRIRLESK